MRFREHPARGPGHLLLLAQLAVPADYRRDHFEVLLRGPTPTLAEPASLRFCPDVGPLPRACAHRPIPAPLDSGRLDWHLKEANRLIVVGRGFEYTTARELALKLKELARLPADPYSAADFLHGPQALVEPGHPVIAIATSGAAAADLDALLERLGELGVERIVITDRPAALAGGTLGIQLPLGLPEWLMPIATIVPGQLLALHLAIAKGIDPENPRWIQKVTLTN